MSRLPHVKEKMMAHANEQMGMTHKNKKTKTGAIEQ